MQHLEKCEKPATESGPPFPCSILSRQSQGPRHHKSTSTLTGNRHSQQSPGTPGTWRPTRVQEAGLDTKTESIKPIGSVNPAVRLQVAPKQRRPPSCHPSSTSASQRLSTLVKRLLAVRFAFPGLLPLPPLPPTSFLVSASLCLVLSALALSPMSPTWSPPKTDLRESR